MKLITLDEMNNLVRVCQILSEAPFYQKLGASGVLAIYLTAVELGLPPMYCLNGGLYNIEGKVSLSGNAINMMLINAGWEVRFIEYSENACELSFKYPRSNRIEKFRYTIEEAHKAGYFGVPGPQGTFTRKPKDNWLCHPKNMLFNRAIANGGRMFAPDVLGNCYGIGELENEDHIPMNNSYPDLEYEKSQQKIAFKPVDDVEQFKKRHNIEQGQPIYDYVINIAHKKNIPTDQAMTECFLNEKKFVDSFERFRSKQA